MAVSKLELMRDGAFPNQIDPWVEKGRYFHQLHAQMISYLLEQIQEPLNERGYIVGREASIQITPSEPDLFIETSSVKPLQARNYDAVVASLSLDAGIAFQIGTVPDIDRLFIESVSSGRLVTVIELISPSNKTEDEGILRYQDRRQNLLSNAVDVVEIDLSRSIKHLINDKLAKTYPYHIAIHLYNSYSRFLGIALTEPLKAFALPVENQAIPVELHLAYKRAYTQLRIANQMLNHGHYTAENLPFPSILNSEERQNLLEALEAWKLLVKSSE